MEAETQMSNHCPVCNQITESDTMADGFLIDATTLCAKCKVEKWKTEAEKNEETLRDRFAMAAMQGIVSLYGKDPIPSDFGTPEGNEGNKKYCAGLLREAVTLAYIYADAMLEARKK